MKSLPKSAVTFFVVLLLLLSAASSAAAFPGGPAVPTHEVIDLPVEWTMSPDCQDVPAHPLTGTGMLHLETTTRVFPDGSTSLQAVAVATGTASDSTGAYHWVYNNAMTERWAGGSSTRTVHMLDTFELSGTGDADLFVAFNWRWTYTLPAEQWPPSDNWQQIVTIGDPLHCDPL